MTGEPTKKRKHVAKDSAENGEGVEVDEEAPACQSCRKRKAKCSRGPTCRQCMRLGVECIYDERRQRPGMRSGAIEALNQRVAALEHMMLGQGLLLKPLLAQARDLLSCKEPSSNLRQEIIEIKDMCASAARDADVAHKDSGDAGSLVSGVTPPVPRLDVAFPHDVHAVVELYFQQVHRWIPVLHKDSFMQKLYNPLQRSQIAVILHAILAICLPIQAHATAADMDIARGQSEQHRREVILSGMEFFSVENLQAMIIVAFDTIGSGKGPSAWSLVGSMSRTVEQLQLSVEVADAEASDPRRKFLVDRSAFLPCAASWAETEERRRVFWTVFLLDRYCSVAAGWNNSLTEADIQRRLPCEGNLWQAGQPVRTPLFGIAERSSNSEPTTQLFTPDGEQQSISDEEVESIGGFAYCIEAVENLNIISTFFLRRSINFDNLHEVRMWLLKFKELDLRLVRWRLCLPSRWADASASDSEGGMDCNLALAHMMHNTAVIQLHQTVAYHAAKWSNARVTLPWAGSADTCVSAALEIKHISSEYIARTHGLVSPSMPFCLFVAGRILLVHSACTKTPVHSAFNETIDCLNQLARRWNGVNCESLAHQLSRRLVEAQDSSRLNPASPVYASYSESPGRDVPYVDVQNHRTYAQSTRTRECVQRDGSVSLTAATTSNAATPNIHPFSPLNQSSVSASDGLQGSLNYLPEGFEDLSQIFDESFEEMLRVSSYFGDDSFQKNDTCGM